MSNPKSRTTWRRIPKGAAAMAQMLAAAPSAASREIVRSVAVVGIPRTIGAKTPKKDVIGLLQLAAEVEHALMVQYLYAAASAHGPTPEGVDAGRDFFIPKTASFAALATRNLTTVLAGILIPFFTGREQVTPLALPLLEYCYARKARIMFSTLCRCETTSVRAQFFTKEIFMWSPWNPISAGEGAPVGGITNLAAGINLDGRLETFCNCI